MARASPHVGRTWHTGLLRGGWYAIGLIVVPKYAMWRRTATVPKVILVFALEEAIGLTDSPVENTNIPVSHRHSTVCLPVAGPRDHHLPYLDLK